MAVKVEESRQGPNCFQLEIHLTGEHERGYDHSFKQLLSSIGLQVEKDYGGNARGYYKLTVLVTPEKVNWAKSKIKEWESFN